MDSQWDHQHIIGQFVSKTCMKVKEIDSELESANDVQYLSSREINIHFSTTNVDFEQCLSFYLNWNQ